MKRLPLIALISIGVFIFALGIGLGAFVDRQIVKRNLPQFAAVELAKNRRKERPPLPMGGKKSKAEEMDAKRRRKEHMQKLERELRLTSDQRKQIETILETERENFDAARKIFFDAAATSMRKTQENIKAALTEEQYAEFEKQARFLYAPPMRGKPFEYDADARPERMPPPPPENE